jgi:hypothetical protein
MAGFAAASARGRTDGKPIDRKPTDRKTTGFQIS